MNKKKSDHGDGKIQQSHTVQDSRKEEKRPEQPVEDGAKRMLYAPNKG